ncbi:FG-GAP-like repeat-containing protein [Nocardioides sp. LHG3406-4]|uniref:FG-GAP-like repeat-containing protein n=1 Tax=Nocardioides sp. LHG3406-4 TaxID=2804575 RepID=UPI003CF299BB
MRSSQVRFITACQQLLALGVVVAVLTPAASIVSLDVVARQPGAQGGQPSAAAYLSSARARVPAKAVEPKVTDYSLTPDAAATKGGTMGGQRQVVAPHELVSEPAPVVGYGAVGVTWEHGEQVPADDIAVTVRTRTGDDWSDWMSVPYDDDHDPDPASREARHARPGTDALLVGDVDQVQVKAVTDAGAAPLPDDLQLSVIDPGKPTATVEEAPALETGAAGARVPADQPQPQGQEAIAMQAATTAPMPVIYSRAQWGADERMRDAKSLRYGTVSAGFVHHTVNANDYTADQVPAIIRSIYAYHVKSRGWSDIGYNYLVDRFGRIWEGRYGGIDKPVVGAHTLGYNDYSFAMSAIGNFDVVQPPEVMIQAYGALFAWKLGLHGVNPASTSQQVGKKVFQAINGHRDAGSTACPGKYLYAQIPRIRQLAASAQSGWTATSLQSNLAGTAYPDMVVRRASDKRGFVVTTGGLSAFSKPVVLGARGWKGKKQVLVSGDLTGDGHADLVMTSRNGVAKIRPGRGNGTFAATTRTMKSFKGHNLVTPVGDINHDGRNDLIAKVKGGARVDAFLGTRKGRLKPAKVDSKWGRFVSLTAAGDVTGDGRPDVLGRDKQGAVWLRAGTGVGTFEKSRKVVGNWAPYNKVIGGSDYTADGRPDLIGRMKNGKVYLLAGRGDGTFGAPVGAMRNVAGLQDIGNGGQLVGDPAPDLIARRGGELVVVPNAGTYDLGNPIDTGADLSGSDVLLNVGDWDRDGFGDVITREANGTMQLRRGDGQGHLAAPRQVGTGWTGVANLAAVGDVTGDGLPDLSGEVGGVAQIYPGTGSGIGAARTGVGAVSPRSALKYDFAPYDWVIGISDIKANGHADVLARERATGHLYVLYGNDTGVSGRRFLGEGMGIYDLAG